jgi:16S rRNA (adenine1518-N6/adenine1519-N6)-dimethyltransferase
VQHRARKRFGQNFLTDTHIIHQIISAINPKKTDALVEIGPGLGALTRPLLNSVDNLIAIEIDRDLHAHLLTLKAAEHQLQLVQGDALTFDYASLDKKSLRIVGNLPYNISTPILIHLLSYTSIIQDMHFMLQKEVVDRLAAQPGSKAYGRLSILLQYYANVEALFDVPPESFNPIPKVMSAIVRITPHTHSPFEPVDMALFSALVAKAFSMRRKTLANNLKPLISVAELTALDIDPKQRPEQLDIKDYVRLTLLMKEKSYVLPLQ